ncbi:CHAD domain-containing protein [Rhizobium sp. YIM 134829]|uniref:CHAD domain-containing protein n=1 Tax=Rhizobium sp. YIM 134829 TaxID=3390453 RepID=UPI00397E5747
MAFKLSTTRPFTREFHRLASGQLDQAINQLERRPEGPFEAIHAARKAVKKVRGLYRFVATAAPEARKTENRRLRDASRAVARLRDAQALVETAQILRDRLADEEEDAAQRAVDALTARRGWMIEAETDLDRRLFDYTDALKAARAAAGELDFDNRPKAARQLASAAWRRSLTRVKAALEAAREDRTPDAFHTLRKRCQDDRFHHLLLMRLWPAALKAREQQIKALIDRLGLLHDFAVLLQTLIAEPALLSPDDQVILRHALEVEIGAEGRRALIKAEALYALDPKREALRIERLWKLAY